MRLENTKEIKKKEEKTIPYDNNDDITTSWQKLKRKIYKLNDSKVL